MKSENSLGDINTNLERNMKMENRMNEQCESEKQPVPESEITIEMKDLDQKIGRSQELLCFLVEKLAPVLREDTPHTSDGVDKPLPDVSLASDIAVMVNRLGAINESTNNIIDRIAL